MATMRTYGLRDNMLREAVLDRCNSFMAERMVREWSATGDTAGLAASLDSIREDMRTEEQKNAFRAACEAL